MSDKYFTVHIRAYLDKDKPAYIGEEKSERKISMNYSPIFHARKTRMWNTF